MLPLPAVAGRAFTSALLGLFLLCSTALGAQATTVYTEAWRTYKLAEAHYEDDLLAKAQREYGEVIELLLPIQTPEAETLRRQAELNRAKIAVRLDKIEGEKLILDFVRRYQPDPIANEALLEVANYYFNEGDLKAATEYYKRVPIDLLPPDRRAEVNFRLGYAAFVQKQFDEAKRYFQFSKNEPGDFYYPTNYYLGMIYFFEGNYDTAVDQFRIAEKDRQYQPYIPYYLTQIYFAQRRYDELIAYAVPNSTNGRIRNQKEINQLLGQAYFEKGNFQEALPLLETYARNNQRMQAEELYQLGFTQYKLGDYPAAAETFRELATEQSVVGQSANYYLGDIYLRAGDGPSARNAFGIASRLTFDPGIREEALINYAKLSYELGYPADATTAIEAIPPTGKYFIQGQELLGRIFSSSQDYAKTLQVLEGMPNRTPQLQEAYQRAAFGRALEVLGGGGANPNEVEALLDKSLAQPVNPNLRAQALYWKADIAHSRGDYPRSSQLANQFLTLATGMQDLPDQSSVHTGNYLQGYNYLKQDNYPAAREYFVTAVEGIERNIAYIEDFEVRERILGDAVLRAGDAYFSGNQYEQALRYYDDAINRQTAGFVYALYQKAMIEGLRNNTTEKVLALEQLVRQYPKSEFADDALFQLALSYVALGQSQRALQPLRRVVSDYKVQSNLVNQSLLQLGLISYNLGNSEASLNYYKQVFSNNPTAAEAEVAQKALYEIYVKNNGDSQAYFDFMNTIPGYEIDADGREQISYQSAYSQYQGGNYEQSVRALTDYLRQYPNGANSLAATFYRADSYVALKQYEQALPDYETVVAAGPSNLYLKALNKGSLIAYNSVQDFQKSYRLYTLLEEAADSERGRLDAQIGALRAAYRLGDVTATEQYARKVADNPASPRDQQITANFYLGKIAFDRQDFAAARQAFELVKANSDDEQTAEARYLLAKSYYLGRDLDTAERLANEANTESSRYPYWVAKSVLLLSDILRDKNDLLNARAVLEALLEFYEGDPAVIEEARTKLQEVQTRIESDSRINRPADARPGQLELDNSN